MNDADLESALRAVHLEFSSPAVSPALRARVLAIPATRTKPWHRRWPTPTNRWHPLSSGIRLIAALAIITVGTGALLFSVGQSPTPAPTPAPSPTPAGITNGWIAYATEPGETGSPQSHDAWSDIYVVREGREPRLLVGDGDHTTRNICPGFSADGKRLAYGEGTGMDPATLEAEHRAIVVVVLDADGSIVEPALRLPIAGAGRVPCPVWSPDGRRLAYPETDAIWVVGIDGTSTLVSDRDPGAGLTWTRVLSWSPDGTTIAAAGYDANFHTDARLLSADGGTPSRRLPRDTEFAHSVDWSPDGAWIGATEVPRNKKGTRPRYAQARLIPAHGQGATIDLGRDTGSPLWSPSGDRLLYWSEDGLVIADGDGSDPSAFASDGYGSPVMWSPDGRSLLMRRDNGATSWELYTMPASGPAGETTLIRDIPTASARSFPGRGDISWQAVIP